MANELFLRKLYNFFLINKREQVDSLTPPNGIHTIHLSLWLSKPEVASTSPEVAQWVTWRGPVTLRLCPTPLGAANTAPEMPSKWFSQLVPDQQHFDYWELARKANWGRGSHRIRTSRVEPSSLGLQTLQEMLRHAHVWEPWSNWYKLSILPGKIIPFYVFYGMNCPKSLSFSESSLRYHLK